MEGLTLSRRSAGPMWYALASLLAASCSMRELCADARVPRNTTHDARRGTSGRAPSPGWRDRGRGRDGNTRRCEVEAQSKVGRRPGSPMIRVRWQEAGKQIRDLGSVYRNSHTLATHCRAPPAPNDRLRLPRTDVSLSLAVSDASRAILGVPAPS